VFNYKVFKSEYSIQPLLLVAFVLCDLWYGSSPVYFGSGWVLIFAAALPLGWCAWFWFIPAANGDWIRSIALSRVHSVANGTLLGFVAGSSWIEPLMYLPVRVYWLGGEWFDRVLYTFISVALNSTHRVLVWLLGVVLIDVDLLPMAKPFSN
jgi:hypothetical protein